MAEIGGSELGPGVSSELGAGLTSIRQPGRRGLTAALVVLGWVAVVAVTATAGWLVVDRAGVSLLGTAGEARAAASSTASSTATTPGQPSALTTVGGRVAATCGPGDAVSLQSAIPAQGWKVEYTPGGPKILTVEFKRSGRASIEVHATCVAGRAVVTLDSGSGSGSGSGGASPSTPRPSATTTDDHGGGTKGGGGSGGSGSGGSGSGGSGSSSGGGSGKGGGGSDDH